MQIRETPSAIEDVIRRRVLLASSKTRNAAFGIDPVTTTYLANGALVGLAIGSRFFPESINENIETSGEPFPGLVAIDGTRRTPSLELRDITLANFVSGAFWVMGAGSTAFFRNVHLTSAGPAKARYVVETLLLAFPGDGLSEEEVPSRFELMLARWMSPFIERVADAA